MSTIVGYADGETVWMGSDSQVTQGNVIVRAGSSDKVRRIGEFLVGIAGDCALVNFIDCHHHLFTQFEKVEIEDTTPAGLRDAIAGIFLPSYRSALDADGLYRNGYCQAQGNQDTTGTLLLGWRGNLFLIGNFIDCVLVDQFEAIGSGAEFATGAMDVLNRYCPKIEPYKKVELAIECAARYDIYTCGPIIVLVSSNAA